MKIKPLHDWVVINQTGPEERTAGGIIIPETAKEKPQWGIVESAGPGSFETIDKKDPKAEKKFVATEVRPGDRVLYEKYTAKEFKVDGREVLMVRERYVLGIIEEKDSDRGAGTALQKKGPGAVAKKGPGAVAKRGPSALQKKEPGALAEVKKPAAKKKPAKK